MKTRTYLVFLNLVVLVQCAVEESTQLPPMAQVNPVEDEYFGVKITDPYRYMEDLQDSPTVRWIEEQSDYARTILNSIPGRQELIDKMTEFDSRESAQISWLRITDNDRYFYLKTMPENQVGKLFLRNGFNRTEILLFDPVNFSADTSSTYILTNVSPSPDGSMVFFVLYPANGTGENLFITMNVENREIIEQSDQDWMSIASWLPDGRSYLINLPSEATLPQGIPRFYDSQIFLHFIGADSNKDRVIFSRKECPELGIKPADVPNAIYDKNSQCIFCSLLSSDKRNHVFYMPASNLNEKEINWKLLFEREDEVYNFAASDKDIYLRTSKNSPNFRILKISLADPDLDRADVAVPENPQASLTSFRLTGDGIYYTLLRKGVQNELYQWSFEKNEPLEIELPAVANYVSLSSKGYIYRELWLELQDWAGQHLRYLYVPDKDEFKTDNLSAIIEYPENKSLQVETLMVPSHDRVEIPLTLIYKEPFKKKGTNSVLLFGYGSYGDITSQVFDPNMLLWVHKGGILAIAHVRGGGEFGDTWHRSGMKTSKPNTWKDFIACTEYLISEKITLSSRIAITSRSAGGILIGRAMTARPELFAAVIPQVGLLNPLRLEMMQNSPFQEYEFGNVEDSVECMALYEMDPYHHLTDGTEYPATLVIAGMLDQMIPLWMPAKFAARLQSVNDSENPVLFWADPESYHMKITKTQQFEVMADILSFAFWQTGHPDFQIK